MRHGWRAAAWRSGGRGLAGWAPVKAGLYSSYEVALGGSATQITDSSGNGRAAITNGTTTAAAAHLAYATTPYLHLESAGAGTNSLSCTAPATTASYSAAPLSGGAATTGAASAGAFTFTTTGDWKSVSLLNGSAVEIAKFDATLSSQTGHTDSYGVSWTLNFGTAGRKTAILSPAALTDRASWLFGTNDAATVPTAAMPPMTAGVDFTIIMVGRQRATPVSFGAWLNTKATTPTTVQGVDIEVNGTTIYGVAGDGTNAAALTQTFTPGQRLVVILKSSGTTQSFSVNGGTASTTTAPTGNRTGLAATWQIGVHANSAYQDFEFEALHTLSRATTAAEDALFTAYHRGGV